MKRFSPVSPSRVIVRPLEYVVLISSGLATGTLFEYYTTFLHKSIQKFFDIYL